MLILGNLQVNKLLINIQDCHLLIAMSHDKERGEDSIFTGLSAKEKVTLYKKLWSMLLFCAQHI